MIQKIAIIIVVILMILDLLSLIKELKKPNYDMQNVFIPIWLQKIIPFVVSVVAYSLIIYAIIL